MTDLIGLLLAWAGLLSKPSGRHRAAPGPRSRPIAAPPTLDTSLPTHRSPYGLHEIHDGTTTIAVRPYVTAHEQRQRRRELAMAAMGFDMPGPYWIHGTEVA
ncbi:hypothetical protein F3K40_13600 [Streptomyces sp. LBUM 1478]|nr:hypothetical protein [Streptomyces sp. LBUM 1484]MBP5876505.1 hypothetical protein [Streptomyces sp. LBUM 1477]MBP5884261.1 hypothetical protein [Streptomyces sp. LBUM 1487]MBP5900276.1 hypothetical protein [Streptomyces sp. LBUM 1488]MBP5906546.1 hypothetical protein [Streptomyces sp. LBUM 1478]MBP5930763.1 hypothetical protein [Streptomyces sp. LBUM 1479]QTU51011.1 hypothetical protein F3K20_19250 [Streptomyces sp. LBUM 1482]QTU67176.1 hypothetical protein F3K22_18205 [Streptomyces sp. 